MKGSNGQGNKYTNVLPVMRYFYGIAWKNDKLYFVLIAVNMLVRGVSPFINIVLPKFIIDELLGGKRPDVITRLIVLLVTANLTLSLFNNLWNLLTNRSRTRMEMKFDQLLAEKTMTMDYEYTENAKVLNNLESARTGMSWYSGGIGGLSENLTSIVSSFITLSGAVYILGRLSPWLIAILLGMIFANMLIVAKAQHMQSQFMKDLVGINRKFGYYFNLVKNFRYGKDIRMYSAHNLIANRVNEYIEEDWAVEIMRTKLGNRYQLVMVLINVAQQTLLYGYLGLRVLAKEIGIGDLQMLISASLSFSGSFSSLLSQFIDVAKNADFMNEYRKFMQYPSLKETGSTSLNLANPHVFEFKNVSFKYPDSDSYALKNVSITIPTGQKLSIVGENGAGKTTFIKLLCRLYDPTEGEILLDGVNVKEYSAAEYVKVFAPVFQDFRLFAFTIGENVAASEHVVTEKLIDAVAKGGFSDKLNSLEKGLETPLYRSFDENGVELSGGESQKLAISRAVYKDAPVIILDEPTAALDPVAEFDIYNHFDHLVGGKTTIYISHRLSSCRFCDRIAVFHDGELIEFGQHGDLVNAAGKYNEMWNAQAQYYDLVEQAG